MTNPLDILAMITFLITGLVITRLTTRVREEAAISDRQRRQVNLLYDLARQLLALDPDDALLGKSVERFRDVFSLEAVSLFDALNEECHSSGTSRTALSDRTRSAFCLHRDDDQSVEAPLRCLRVAGKTIGAVGFEGLVDAELTAGPLAALAAAMLERARAFHSASRAAAAEQAEVFRAAVLDALAHEFKTPLATILMAAGGLREIGPLGPEQLELAEMVETEASRLSGLTSRVLRTSRLDGGEVKPQLVRTDVADLVCELVDQYSRHSTDRRFYVSNETAGTEVLADCDLLRLALRQLLDNACMYSPPGSAVEVSVDMQNERAEVRVLNSGNLIRANERSRIFERFYRGSAARCLAPGSGLGLYFASKIVRAHGGCMELEDAPPQAAGSTTVFRLTLPLAKASC